MTSWRAGCARSRRCCATLGLCFPARTTARSPMPICSRGCRRLLRSFDGDRALRAFSAVDRALAALERNASPKIVADWVAFQI